MTEHAHHAKQKQDTDYKPCDARYRSSSYFLEDQLRCSEAVDDFQSMKTMVNRLAAFDPFQHVSFCKTELKPVQLRAE